MARDTIGRTGVCRYCDVGFVGRHMQLERHVAAAHPDKYDEWKRAGKPHHPAPPRDETKEPATR